MAPLRAHAAFLVLLLIIAPLILFFAGQAGVASMGDDSLSYLTLARHFSGTAGPLLEPWVQHYGHFPPLFPLALGASGGDTHFAIGHRVVALFAVASLALVYAHGLLRFSSAAPALAVATLFVLMPSAWISIKGILSESMFLFASLAAIGLYEWRLAHSSRGRTLEWAALGLLLAAACLTRAAGLLLVLAYSLHIGLRAMREPGLSRWRAALPAVVAAAAVGLWIAIRPQPPGDTYLHTVLHLVQAWGHDPSLQLALGSQLLAGGWIASFTAQSDVSWISRAILLALAALAIAGAIRRAFANGLDGWYALVSIAVMLAWIFPEDNQRRLLYSVLPLLLVHAASTAISVVDGFGPPKWRRPILAALALAPMLLCLPATILVARKSMEREPFAMAGEYTAADITDYYTTINVGHARAIAARHAAVLHGFERLKRDTPIESRVMWTRPEYVALLGERQSVPLYYHWDARALAIAIRESKTTHVVWSLLSKSDLRRQNRAVADHLEILRTVGDYASAAYAVRNAVTNQEDFVLLKVDAQRLDAYLAK